MASFNVPLDFQIFKGNHLLRIERLVGRERSSSELMGMGKEVRIGTLASSDLRLEGEGVSRMHAVIEITGPDQITIIDLGSHTGTFVNGRKVRKQDLRSGDELQLGDNRVIVIFNPKELVSIEEERRAREEERRAREREADVVQRILRSGAQLPAVGEKGQLFSMEELAHIEEAKRTARERESERESERERELVAQRFIEEAERAFHAPPELPTPTKKSLTEFRNRLSSWFAPSSTGVRGGEEPGASPRLREDAPALSALPREETSASDESLPSDVRKAMQSTVEPGASFSGIPVLDPERYEILGELLDERTGRPKVGGMGRVLKACDRYLGRVVALKQIKIQGASSSWERFLREAKITARLQHPAIVPIYDAGRWPDGELVYAMKLIGGSSLDEIIKEKPSLTERLRLLPSLLAVCEAVAYAHTEGVIHRDLKPQNILLGDFGETVVIDWGLAKELEGWDAPVRPDAASKDQNTNEVKPELTGVGVILGTPAYMSPEQAQGRAVDEGADIYALGAILYHLLAGAPPYTGKTTEQIRALVCSGPPLPLEQRQPGVPKYLADIVKKAMARERKDRYLSAKHLAEDLKRFQNG